MKNYTWMMLYRYGLKADSHSTKQSAFSAVDCINAEIEKFLSLCRNTTVHCRIRTSVNEPLHFASLYSGRDNRSIFFVGMPSMWPDWAFGKSLTFLGNLVKVPKSIIFLLKSFLGNFYRHLAIFFSGHTACHTTGLSTTRGKRVVAVVSLFFDLCLYGLNFYI